MAWLGNPVHIGNDLICNKARLTSLLLSKHFWQFTSQTLCMLLPVHSLAMVWWNYGLVYVQMPANCLNQSDTKFVPASETTFFVGLNFWTLCWPIWLGHLLTSHHPSGQWGICSSNLQYTIVFYYLYRIHTVLSSCVFVFADNSGIYHTVSWHFLYPHSYPPSIPVHALGTLSFLFPCGWYAAAVVSVSAIEKELLFLPFIVIPSIITSAFVICQSLPIAKLHFNFLVWQALYYICLHLLPVCILLCCCLHILSSSLMSWWHLCLYSFVLCSLKSLLSVWLLQDNQSNDV